MENIPDNAAASRPFVPPEARALVLSAMSSPSDIVTSIAVYVRKHKHGTHRPIAASSAMMAEMGDYNGG
jgi:hypothetical protein